LNHDEIVSFLSAAYGRHGSFRRLGHGGRGVGAPSPGITGRTKNDGSDGEDDIAMSAVPDGTD
jgi:hypothetical protein